MIELLPKIALYGNRPSFYDTDAKTSLELNAITYGKVNELVEAYNTYTENIDKIVQDFITGQIEDRETFETALRQEFQDFIDIVDLKVRNQDKKMSDFEKSVEDAIAVQNRVIAEAERYMNENLAVTVSQYIEGHLHGVGITMSTNYNAANEELTFVYVATE